MTYRKNSSEGQWEFSGSIKLLPYELSEAQQDGLDAWLGAKIGSRCAHIEVGAPEGAVVPVRLLVHGARTTPPPEIATGSYANDPEEAIKKSRSGRGAPAEMPGSEAGIVSMSKCPRGNVRRAVRGLRLHRRP
jgi:hypothetical protein